VLADRGQNVTSHNSRGQECLEIIILWDCCESCGEICERIVRRLVLTKRSHDAAVHSWLLAEVFC